MQKISFEIFCILLFPADLNRRPTKERYCADTYKSANVCRIKTRGKQKKHMSAPPVSPRSPKRRWWAVKLSVASGPSHTMTRKKVQAMKCPSTRTVMQELMRRMMDGLRNDTCGGEGGQAGQGRGRWGWGKEARRPKHGSGGEQRANLKPLESTIKKRNAVPLGFLLDGCLPSPRQLLCLTPSRGVVQKTGTFP